MNPPAPGQPNLLNTAHQAGGDPSMKMLADLLAHFPGLAYRCWNDEKWTAVYISHGALDLTGYSAAEFMEQVISYDDIVHAEDRLMVHEEVERAGREKRDFILEYRIVCKGGTEKWVWERGRKCVSQPGQREELIGFITDVTPVKRVELELRETQRLFEKAQSVGRLGSWMSGLGNDESLYWSRETCRIFGVDPEAFDKRVSTFFKMVYPPDLDHLRETMRHAVAARIPYQVEHRIVRPDGSIRWVLEQADIERDLDGNPARLIGVVQDITEKRELEEQLRHAQKMEAIGHLAGGLAHDFNNILTIIQGHASLLQAAPKNAVQAAECAKHILSASERAAQLTTQLLTFSRKQPIDIKPVKLTDIVRSMTTMLNSLLGGDIRLELDLPETLPYVEADSAMIEQILLNLAVNSCDAMPKGGVLSVQLKEEIIGEDFARYNSEVLPGRTVCLSVTDNGCGISYETMPHIFEPFFTTKEPGKGTGLGLATVYAITKQHRGWINVVSARGEGTTFKVYFPATEIVPENVQRSDSEQRLRTSAQKVLVVEDEPLISSLAKICLEHLGYQVVEAANAQKALETWRSAKGDFDIVVSDIIMPESISGLELAGRLVIEKPDLPVLFTSGYSPDIFGKELELKGKWRFLQKPYTPTQLAAAIRECLEAGAT